jgi:hypothetical protein
MNARRRMIEGRCYAGLRTMHDGRLLVRSAVHLHGPTLEASAQDQLHPDLELDYIPSHCDQGLHSNNQVKSYEGNSSKATDIDRPNWRHNTPRSGKGNQKTYNTRDSPVVTHPSTNLAITGLSMGERTGSRVFLCLWSYVTYSGQDGNIMGGPSIRVEESSVVECACHGRWQSSTGEQMEVSMAI